MPLPFTHDAPIRTPETEPFWRAANAGQLLIKRCNSCEETFYYPRALCPFCLSDTSWVEASGRGTVHSYTTVHARDGAYVVALVTLDEGPTLITNLIVPGGGQLAIGQKVRAEFAETAGADRLPVFVPS